MSTQRRRNRQAISQTREDQLDFKKNRAAGDKVMTQKAILSTKDYKRGGPHTPYGYIGPDQTEGSVAKDSAIAMPKNGTRKPGMSPNEKEGTTYLGKGPKVLRKKYPANEEALKIHLLEELEKDRQKRKTARGQTELKHDAYVKGKKT